MSLIHCLERAAAMNVISRQELHELRQRYEGMIADGVTNAEAKARMQKQIEAEARHRERAALLTNLAVDRLLMDLSRFRNWKGDPDEAEAFIQAHETFGHDGTFMQDAEGRREVILREALSELKDLIKDGRRGHVSGDLRRRLPWAKARMDNVVREIMGVSTGDAKAAIIAKAWEQTAENLRLRFNDAGGAIGKMQGGYIPQSHDALALLAFGKGAWVNHMMEPGRLDRPRMVDGTTGKPLSDSELRSALGLAWDRITTDGFYDADVSANPAGRGALYTQHMDHRFIHFAGPDKWMEYSKRFGNGGDVFAAMMGHVGMMARDIAHMEVFGPNPNRTREYLKQSMIKRAANVKSNARVIEEQVAQLKHLTSQLTRPNPEFETLTDRIGQIQSEIDGIRRKYAPQLGGKASKRNRARLDKLEAEFQEVSRNLLPYWDGKAEVTITDKAVEAEMQTLLDEMRSPDVDLTGKPREHVGAAAVGFRDGDREIARVNKKIARADAMWEHMRGGQATDPKLAARFQSVRNMVSAGSLGSAVISSLTDPAFGQDVRLRMGMGLKESNFARIAITTLKELFTAGNRDDAIAAMLGVESATRVLHRQAAEIRSLDHRFWSAYMADRVLTIGLLAPWTQAGKHMIGLDIMRFVGKLTDTEWFKLPEELRNTFEMHGISQAEWTRLRLVDKHDGLWLRPNEVIAADRELGERYLQMILRETKFAIPEATVRSSTLMQGGKRGEWGGELFRSMFQFKGFAFGVMMLHQARIARELGAGDVRSKAQAAGYAATLAITSVGLGMVALALKDMKDGKDPRKWLDEKTWLDPFYLGEAFLQAGGLGIYGDFLRASENRMGGGLAGTLAGPLAGKVENVIRMVGPGQVTKHLHDKETTVGEEAVRLVRSGVVPGSNHWALSMLYQRVLMDRLQRLADPKAQASFNRQVGQRMKDYYQQYFWRPGAAMPDRGPDVTRALATK